MFNVPEAIRPLLESVLASELQNTLFWNVASGNSPMAKAGSDLQQVANK